MQAEVMSVPAPEADIACRSSRETRKAVANPKQSFLICLFSLL